MYNEHHNHQSIGEFKDIITYDDGHTVETPWRRNTIVDDIGKLVACLFKCEQGYTGISYWSIGSGDGKWTGDGTVPDPNKFDHGVMKEIGRKKIEPSDISFVDNNGDPVKSVTNRILIDITFGRGECNGEWREFSIIGGNATDVLGTGIAINHKTHGLITKTDNMQIRRQIRFTFR